MGEKKETKATLRTVMFQMSESGKRKTGNKNDFSNCVLSIKEIKGETGPSLVKCYLSTKREWM